MGQYQNEAVEAVLFNREQLADEPWSANWSNMRDAVSQYGNDNVVFHFPMNGSDYIDDSFVSKRLVESYDRASDLGIAGLIVHSNRIRTAEEWEGVNQDAERTRIFEALLKLWERNRGTDTWIGLENMPSVGNYGSETDPLFISTDDFDQMPYEIGIVWDVCHALCSVQYAEAYRSGRSGSGLHVRPDASQFTDPTDMAGRVVHWHFASSKGLNIPREGSVCTEGVLPAEGDMEESAYAEQLIKIASVGGGLAVNFEVKEADYSQRNRGPAIMEWANQIISQTL